jgi:hypothetical protein
VVAQPGRVELPVVGAVRGGRIIPNLTNHGSSQDGYRLRNAAAQPTFAKHAGRVISYRPHRHAAALVDAATRRQQPLPAMPKLRYGVTLTVASILDWLRTKPDRTQL